LHFPRPGPGSCRLSAPHGPGAAGAGGALRAAGAAAAAAGFTRDAGIEAAAGDAVQGLALRLAVAQRLIWLSYLFEPGFNTKLDATHLTFQCHPHHLMGTVHFFSSHGWINAMNGHIGGSVHKNPSLSHGSYGQLEILGREVWKFAHRLIDQHLI